MTIGVLVAVIFVLAVAVGISIASKQKL